MSAAADQHVAPEFASRIVGSALDEATARDRKARLRGESLHPGEDGYAATRTVRNAMIARRPAAGAAGYRWSVALAGPTAPTDDQHLQGAPRR